MTRKLCGLARSSVVVGIVCAGAGVAQAQPAEAPPAPAGAIEPGAPPEPAVPPTPLPPSSDALAARFDDLLGRPGGLTAARAGEQAAATSNSARARARDVDMAGYDVDKAVSAFVPEVTLTARYTRQSAVDNGSIGSGGGMLVGVDPAAGVAAGPIAPGTQLYAVPFEFSFPALLNQYWLQASLNVPISDYVLRTRFGLDAARNNERAALLNEQAARLQAGADAQVTYYDWVRARLQLVVTEQTLAQTREQLSLAQRSLEGGRLSRVDVLRAESQVASAELMVSQARNIAIRAEDRLRTMMHDTSGQAYAIGDRLPDGPSADARRAFEQLYAEATAKRVELKALDASASALRNVSRAQKADELPRLAAFANGYYTNPNQRIFPQEDKFTPSWDAGLELVWTPTKIGGARAESRKYAAQAEQRESDAQGLRDALRAEVMEGHLGVQVAAVDIETAERGLAAAEEGFRVRKLLFDNGRATSVEITDAQTVLLQSRLALVNARVSQAVAQIRLDHAVGRDVK